MASKSRPQPTNEPHAAPPSERQPYRLLLVDDDEDEYVLTRGMVQDMRYDHTLDWVNSYEGGVRQALEEQHDVYLVDYYLGEKTGVDLLKTVRERGCRAPIIILTGRDDDGLDLDALEAGATDYLDKNNLNSVLLERAIRYAVRQQHNQNRLEDLVQKVTRLEQLKTDMIRIAAHDLRTPLTVIRGYVRMLKDELGDTLSEVQRGHFAELSDAILRMQRMVGDILSLERIAELSGGYTDPVDLSYLVQEVYDYYAARGTQQFSLEMPDEPVIVYGADAELREAVDNLISNAVKYTPDDGRIMVSLTADPDLALFSVTDTGYGIPKNQQQNLFKPFFRAKTRQTRNITGTGLGLHLVQNIIERHNGEVHFESEEGEGSTFRFMLPRTGDDDL